MLDAHVSTNKMLPLQAAGTKIVGRVRIEKVVAHWLTEVNRAGIHVGEGLENNVYSPNG